MQYRAIFFAALCQGFLPLAHAQADSQVDAALDAIGQLATINGQALACSGFTQAGRAKQLMLAHAPKSARFGEVFDEATQKAFLTQTPLPCPAISDFNQRLNEIELTLQKVLPAQRPTPATSTPIQ